jgi:predicted  nucleic acid-binding Zn-ribbon protein
MAGNPSPPTIFMNESIKQLLALQERDLDLDRLQGELAAIPAKIAALKGQIQANKTGLENAKKELTQLQLARKQQELDLEAQETAIRKHSTELNAVKTNEAYRALLGEIEKAKKEKSLLEDQILQVMDQTDQATRVWKDREVSSKSAESDLQRQISDWEAKAKQLEGQITGKNAERVQAAEAMSKNLTEPYERLHKNRRGAAVVPIRNEQCGGCHMKVSQNLINEVRRGQKLMTCESCSRIVYLEEAGEPVSK